MKIIDVWTIRVIPDEVMPADFKIFIKNKFEYKDPLGEHIYSLESIWLGCKYIIPPGEILESFNEIRAILEQDKCDFFTLVKWKALLDLNYMKQETIRMLVLDKKDFETGFLQFLHEKQEYFDPFGDHVFSPESIWLSMKKDTPQGSIANTYFEIWKTLRNYNCSLFTLA